MTGRILTPDPNARACANCTAWLRWDFIAVVDEAGQIIGRKPTGQCRAAPPSIDPDAIGSVSAAWPVVEADNWCREHQHVRSEQGRAA